MIVEGEVVPNCLQAVFYMICAANLDWTRSRPLVFLHLLGICSLLAPLQHGHLNLSVNIWQQLMTVRRIWLRKAKETAQADMSIGRQCKPKESVGMLWPCCVEIIKSGCTTWSGNLSHPAEACVMIALRRSWHRNRLHCKSFGQVANCFMSRGKPHFKLCVHPEENAAKPQKWI